MSGWRSRTAGSKQSASGAKGHVDGPIQLRIEKVGQLFHTLDPFPFRERDLDAGVEEYVVGWAGELSSTYPLSIQVHLPAAEAQSRDAALIEAAMQNYFAHRVEVLGWDLRDLFRNGRVSAAIGLAVLAVCVIVGKVADGLLGSGFLGRFFDEGLIILGWVALWRPMDTFVYDWWPVVSHRRLYRRLAVAPVRIVAEG